MSIAKVHASPSNLNNSVQPTTEPPKVEQVVKTEERPVQAEKPKQEEPKPKKAKAVKAKVAPRKAQPKGSCQAEIAKYGWRQDVALAVARAESGLRPTALNNNPATKDYSVGCFQINIYGANARTRPSEAALKNPATNVAWAWKIYVANGNSFIGQWGVCRSKVSCY